jgi:hypothetical protein
VLVRFQEPLEIGQGRIEVMDNGHGMSLETMQTTWMEPATLFRKRQQRSEQYGRRVLGERGIGRFTASRLANSLEVVTRRSGEDREIQALFNWSQFYVSGNYRLCSGTTDRTINSNDSSSCRARSLCQTWW